MFWWFVENHDAIVENAGGQRIAWVTMSTRLAELGLTDRNGGCPRPHTARITWLRARKAVAARGAKALLSSANSSELRPMPRSPDAQPHRADLDDHSQPDHPQALVPAVVMSSSPRKPTDLVKSVSVDLPPSQTLETNAVQSITSNSATPVWTPEQIAHRDAMLAKARARLAHTDRFLNLRE